VNPVLQMSQYIDPALQVSQSDREHCDFTHLLSLSVWLDRHLWQVPLLLQYKHFVTLQALGLHFPPVKL